MQQWQACALAQTHRLAFPNSRSWSAQEFHSLLQKPNIKAFGTHDGFVLARFTGDECEILTLSTAPKQRRRGLAKLALNGLIEYAEKGKTRKIMLEVAEDNTAALTLYRTFGFQNTARRKRYYPRAHGHFADALILSRMF